MISIIPLDRFSFSNIAWIKTVLQHDDLLMIEKIYTLELFLFQINFHFYKWYYNDGEDGEDIWGDQEQGSLVSY